MNNSFFNGFTSIGGHMLDDPKTFNTYNDNDSYDATQQVVRRDWYQLGDILRKEISKRNF